MELRRRIQGHAVEYGVSGTAKSMATFGYGVQGLGFRA